VNAARPALHIAGNIFTTSAQATSPASFFAVNGVAFDAGVTLMLPLDKSGLSDPNTVPVVVNPVVPVIVLAPSGPLFEKTVSNMQEVRARGGKIVLISDARGIEEAGEGSMATIEMPEVHPLIAPLVYAVPVQLLAYHVAVLKGTDVDQPRNLAKSVTVE